MALGNYSSPMDNIPSDIYARVHELAVALVNASAGGDDVLTASLYEELLRYYEDIEAMKRQHAFLTEALADFTEDDFRAVALYKLSIEQAQQSPNEPVHTKQISLAERYLSIGQNQQAEAYLRDALLRAESLGDEESIEEAKVLLQKIHAQPFDPLEPCEGPRFPG